MKWLLGCALMLFGCAEAYPIPTQSMAKAAMELHVAEQQGARYSAEGARLCQLAEAALEQSRHRVSRGEPRAAEVAALEGYQYAREARQLTRGTPAAAARENELALRKLGVTATEIAAAEPRPRSR